jgi:hypothetical protein
METAPELKYAQLIGLANNYCVSMQHAPEAEKDEFLAEILSLLPRLYLGFLELEIDEAEEISSYDYLPQYVEEDYYESIRRGVETLFGADDTYLETFEEDMKYSDTPVAASIAEGLADIFQDIYNCVLNIKESDGMHIAQSLAACKENFDSYWGQTLCNVLRALNYLRRENNL